MKILSIESSCDESGISIIDVKPHKADSDLAEATKKFSYPEEIIVLADLILSQIDIHREYGGVYPSLAKREHSRNLVPLLKQALEEAGLIKQKAQTTNDTHITNNKLEEINSILDREPELLTQFLDFIPTTQKPDLDAICVTHGPGLEPCLWTGINLARALALVWDIQIVPVNHMKGHIFSALLCGEENPKSEIRNSKQITNQKSENYKLITPRLPSLALLISGGHTELVLMKSRDDFEIIGQTRDDAVGEAFDKAARLLGLPYPGGPEISKLADEARESDNIPDTVRNDASKKLPRPMINTDDLDFSFSGLKTAVRYRVAEMGELSYEDKLSFALDFENAVTEILLAKTKRAIEQTGVKALIVSGGVIANKHIRSKLEELADEHEGLEVYMPEPRLATDNALMIALAGFALLQSNPDSTEMDKGDIRAQGNLSISR